MKQPKKESPPHAVEGPVRRPEDVDHAGAGGPYGHTVPPSGDKKSGGKKEKP
jgi:hypothetical protein